ncbi:MAG: RNA-directed DNA polymerase [Spirochaetes bacterium]|nr:RNA-directed DNA polymerase [Spirochaetota bacterium]
MSGLEPEVITKIDFNKSINRIISDTKTDFIFAPHLNLIYKYGSEDLIELLKKKLKNGSFECSTPLTLDAPKKSMLSRPGSILLPLDRLLYQILIDLIAQKVEDNIDREHVFSNVYKDNTDMFEKQGESYTKFKDYIQKNTESYGFCLQMDVTSYFDSINQHFLINLIDSLGIKRSVVKLLEGSLLSWSQMNSYGIIQGLSSSDLLGNFNLTNLDYFLKIKEFDYCRYVDDIYVFHDNELELKKLLIEICNKLRNQGLFLNESKTQLSESKYILFQETEFDRMFDEITDMLNEVFEDDSSFFESEYGFQIEWDDEPEEVIKVEGFRLDLIEQLYNKRNEAKWQRDKIIKFCFPLFSKAQSPYPLDTIKDEIFNYPHLAKNYCNYLATIERDNEDITKLIEELIFSKNIIYEYQSLWLFSSLLYRCKVSREVIDLAVQTIRNKQKHETVRAICSILISKFGSGIQLRALRDEYGNEPSIYVKSAILYGTRYFSKGERKACHSAWSGHSELNTLIIRSLAKYNEQKERDKSQKVR